MAARAWNQRLAPTSSSQFAQASALPVSAAPPRATNSPTFALLAVCQLPLEDEIAQVAAQTTTIKTAMIKP